MPSWASVPFSGSVPRATRYYPFIPVWAAASMSVLWPLGQLKWLVLFQSTSSLWYPLFARDSCPGPAGMTFMLMSPTCSSTQLKSGTTTTVRPKWVDGYVLPVPSYFLRTLALQMRLQSVIALPSDQLGELSELPLKVSAVHLGMPSNRLDHLKPCWFTVM